MIYKNILNVYNIDEVKAIVGSYSEVLLESGPAGEQLRTSMYKWNGEKDLFKIQKALIVVLF